MLEPVGVNGSDFIDVEVQFTGFPWDPIGDLFQLGVAASDHGAGARTLWRAIIVPQTSLGIVTYKQRKHDINIQSKAQKEKKSSPFSQPKENVTTT